MNKRDFLKFTGASLALTPLAGMAAGSDSGKNVTESLSNITGSVTPISVAERKASKGDGAPEATPDKAITHANVRISKKPGLGK